MISKIQEKPDGRMFERAPAAEKRLASRKWFGDLRDGLTVISPIVTILGIIITAIWTFIAFNLGDEGTPHAEVQQAIHQTLLPNGMRYVFVDFTISNTGKRRLNMTCAEMRVQQVVPIVPGVDKILDAWEEKEDLGAEPVIPWPTNQSSQRNLTKEQFSIGPGENDHVMADFLIPSEVKVFRVYGYFRRDRPDWYRSFFSGDKPGCGKGSGGRPAGLGMESRGIYEAANPTEESK